MHLRRRTTVLALLLVALALPAQAGSGGDVDQIKARRKIYLGLANVYAVENPLLERDAKGLYQGLEYELATYIAADLGVELRIVPAKWDRFPEALQAGRIDFALQQVFVTSPADTPANVSFSVPYLHTGLALACRTKPCDWASVRAGKHRLAVYNDPTTARFLKDQGVKDVLTYDQETQLYDALLEGPATAVALDYPLLKPFAAKRAKALTFVEGYLAASEGDYAIMLRASSPQLRLRVDAAIRRWRELPAVKERLRQLVPAGRLP